MVVIIMNKKEEKQQEAAKLIQKHWRRYITRKRFLKMLKRQKKKGFTAQELLQSERIYCKDLEFVINRIMIPSKTIITDPEMRRYLFSNIEEIHSMHSPFLKHLEATMQQYNPHTTKLSEVLN